jgi:hypothetical protein
MSNKIYIYIYICLFKSHHFRVLKCEAEIWTQKHVGTWINTLNAAGKLFLECDVVGPEEYTVTNIKLLETFPLKLSYVK